MALLAPMVNNTQQLESSLIAPYTALSGGSTTSPGTGQPHRKTSGLISTGAMSITTRAPPDQGLVLNTWSQSKADVAGVILGPIC